MGLRPRDANIDQLREALFQHKMLMVLCRKGFDLSKTAEEICAMTGEQFGVDNVIRLHLPFGASHEKTSDEFQDEFFNDLIRQTGLQAPSDGQVGFQTLLKQQIDQRKQIAICAQNFEHAHSDHQKSFGSVVRALVDRYADVRIILLGGQGLNALKYQSGSHSILAGAYDIYWPEPDVGATLAKLNNDNTQTGKIRQAAGEDFLLCQEIAEYVTSDTDESDMLDIIAGSQRIWSFVAPFQSDQSRRFVLQKLASAEKIGSWAAWYPKTTLREALLHEVLQGCQDNLILLYTSGWDGRRPALPGGTGRNGSE